MKSFQRNDRSGGCKQSARTGNDFVLVPFNVDFHRAQVAKPKLRSDLVKRNAP